MAAQGLKKVCIDFLWEGLELRDNIYDSEGNILLLPEGEILTEEKMKHIENLCAENRFITTYGDTFFDIISGKHSSNDVQQKVLERYSGYTALKENVERVLKVTSKIKQVSTEEIEPVVVEVFDKLKTIEPADIFQCINVPRPVDEALQRHSLNVAFLNGMMGRWLELSEEDIRNLVLIGILHDIGKTKIPQEILYAPRKLSDEEFATMRRHSVYSYEMLGEEVAEEVRIAVLQHHEKLNGKGYPLGLSGDDISLFARITSISDVYDAMISERCYKEAKIPFDVLEQFREDVFDGLDQKLVAIFIKNMIVYYKQKQVLLSDGSIGDIVYIPPNDISYPVIKVRDNVRQVDKCWYCVRVI